MIRLFEKFINFFFLIIMIWIISVVIIGQIQFDPRVIPAVILISLIMLLGYSVFRKCFSDISEKRIDLIFVIMVFIVFIFSLIIAENLKVDIYNTWDYGLLVRNSFQIASEHQLDDRFIKYYMRYPNNTTYLWLLSRLFIVFYKVLKPNVYTCLSLGIVLNSFLGMLSAVFIYFSVKTLYGSKNALWTALWMLCFEPLYVYMPLIYTDIISMFLFSASLFLFLCSRNTDSSVKQYFSLIGCTFVLILGYKIKATLIILWIAIFIVMIFQTEIEPSEMSQSSKKSFFLKMIVFLVFSIIILKSINLQNQRFLEAYGGDKTLSNECEFPVTHWIMMGLNPNYNGCFVQEDVDYTKSFPNRKSKEQATKKEIISRIKSMGPSGLARHICIKKVFRQWGSPDLMAGNYISRLPLSHNKLRDIVSEKGRYYRYFRLGICGFFIFLLLMLPVYCIQSIREKKANSLLILELVIIGVFFFFLLWECNPRYQLTFCPALIIIASQGFLKLIEK